MYKPKFELPGMTFIPHKHQWRFRGSKPVEPLTPDLGFLPAVKARRIYFRSCAVCDRQSGKSVMLSYENFFLHDRWISSASRDLSLTEMIATLEEIFPITQQASTL